MKTKLLFVKRRFLIVLLFALMFACLIAGTMTSVAFADSVTVIVPVNPGDGTSTIVTVTEDKPVIGDTVSFAEHEWYVIGTDSEGVIAPEGCYTLFAKNDEFGSTAFRSGMSNQDPTIANYKDSDLKKAMDNIANGFLSADIANIVPRATLDGIWGDAVTDQLLWPIGWEEEGVNIATSIRKFGSAYWTRNGFRNSPTDGAYVEDPDTGETIYRPGAQTYSVPIIEAYGYVQESYKLGVLCTAEYPGNTHAVRPASYVKTDAVEKIESKEYKPVVGSQIRFAGYNWYIVGMGDTGPVPGPANTVTLFAASVINDDDDNVVYVNTANNYADGELSTVMKGLSDTLGLSAREKALITDRTLTTADGISGNSVTTPFWPLSIDEYEAIYEFDPSMGACSNAFYWLRTGYGSSAAYYVDNKGKVDWNYGYTGSGVRPACYLDLSDLFFASGDSRMGDSVGAFPSKLEAPLYDTIQRYNFVLHDDTLSLSMVGAAKQRGSSLTFHYDAVQGEQHYLSYLVERASEPGIPVYYGRAVNLSNSGSGTVTVPLTDDGNMRTGIPLVNGEYILRFYTEDRSQDSVIFAGDTVDLDIRVEDNLVYINDLKDVSPATMVGSMGIDPGQADVEAGKQFQFSAFISPFTETGWFDPVLIWDVTGASSYGTSISQDGLLTVALNETSTELRVTVTSRQDYEIQCVSLVTVTPHVHVGTLVAGTPATCTESGTKDYYTCVCGKCFEDADCTTEITDFDTWKIISPLGHDFVWTSNGDGTHTGVCQHDGCEETVTDNCSGGEATFFDYAICEVCGGEYGELIKYRATTDFDGQTYYYETFGEAVDALGEFSTTAEKRAVLKLFDNIDLTSALTFNTGFITLDLNGYMLKQTGSGSVISINDGANFILTDLSGADVTHNYYVADSGRWVFYEGDLPAEAPENATTGTVTGGVITGGTADFDGGGVYVSSGTFTMEGGTISGNTAANYGGGVAVYGKFTMTGGTISGNTATYGGGVNVEGTFTLEDGMITDNTANSGGGVGVVRYATFTMTGGTITGNTGEYGGGVYVVSSTFTLSGGTISGNTASLDGGGVYTDVSTFTMKGGAITNNIASNNYNERGGGGVFVGGTFTMEGGTISGNTAPNGCGGGVNVYNSSDSMFNMTGGYLGDNTASESGNNIFKAGDGNVSISGGYFSEPPAEANIAENCDLYELTALGGAAFDSDYIEGYPYAVYVKGVISISTKNIVYDGSPVAEGVDFTVEGADGITLTYSYKTADGDEFEGLPTNAGKYAVSVYGLNGEKQFLSDLFDITIAKADYVMSGITFEPGSFTYDGQAHSLEIAGTLPDGVTVTYEGNGKVNAGTYTVTAKFAGDYANYNTIDDMPAVLTIDKAMPVYTTPENLTICVEHTLADVILPVGWAWEDSTLSVGEAGEKQFKAIFTPEDTSNYNTVEENVTVTVVAHTGGTATCTDKAVCSVCGMKYGELAEHTAVEIPAVEATCTQSGMTAGSKCSVCGEILVAPEEIASLGHVDENDDELCDRCGFDMSIPEFTIKVTGGTIEGVIGSTVIVEENGSVTVVASEAPEGKEFKGWSIDGGETIISAEAAYTFTASEDTVLTAVFADKQSDVKPGGEITPENPEGLSGGAIAGIVIGSVFGALIIAYGVCALLYKKKILKGAFFEKIYPFIKD